MGWLATTRVEVENVATPEVFVVPVPSVVAPSLNVTISPLATLPVPGELTVTVAVNVTDWPNTDGLTEDPRAVVVLAGFTPCDNAVQVVVATVVSSAAVAAMGALDTTT